MIGHIPFIEIVVPFVTSFSSSPELLVSIVDDREMDDVPFDVAGISKLELDAECVVLELVIESVFWVPSKPTEDKSDVKYTSEGDIVVL